MVSEKVNLLVGVIYENKRYKQLTMRAPIVRDSIEAEEESKEKGILFLSLAMLSKMIIEFGAIPKESINPDLLVQLSDEDFELLQNVRGFLKKKTHWSNEN
jgi:hypothetical protein